MSILVIFKILGLLVNTLTANGMYSLPNKENLLQPIQMQLSINQNFLRILLLYI